MAYVVGVLVKGRARLLCESCAVGCDAQRQGWMRSCNTSVEATRERRVHTFKPSTSVASRRCRRAVVAQGGSTRSPDGACRDASPAALPMPIASRAVAACVGGATRDVLNTAAPAEHTFLVRRAAAGCNPLRALLYARQPLRGSADVTRALREWPRPTGSSPVASAGSSAGLPPSTIISCTLGPTT